MLSNDLTCLMDDQTIDHSSLLWIQRTLKDMCLSGGVHTDFSGPFLVIQGDVTSLQSSFSLVLLTQAASLRPGSVLQKTPDNKWYIDITQESHTIKYN